MDSRRNDGVDLRKQFFRSNDRFFQINGQWYFSAREGDIGPFRTRTQAGREALAYIKARQASATVPGDEMPLATRTQPTIIPGYVYRSVLSMEQQVSAGRHLVLDFEAE